MEITLRDVYDQQATTSAAMSALTTQVATLAATINGRLDTGQTTMTDHETRLRSLERFKYLLLGGCLLGGALSGAIASLIVFILSAHK
jgi:hypothetical protein